MKNSGATYNEAERKPRVTLDHATRVVATIIAATDDAFVALDFLPESVLAAGEDYTHGTDAIGEPE